MVLEIKQSLKMTQQLIMTPQLQQAIKLLQLNRMELQEIVTQEMIENPILEEITETLESDNPPTLTTENLFDPEAEQKRDEDSFLTAKGQEEPLVSGKDEFNWESYIEEFHSTPNIHNTSMKEFSEETTSFENILTKTTSLEDHLAWQLSMIELTDAEKKLGELVIGNLSDEGYLNTSLEDLAKESGLELEDAEEILKMIHNFDPLGIGSRNLRECLLVQAHFLEPRQPLVEHIIENHLSELERKNYPLIAKIMSTPIEKICAATRVILEFEPKPGRSFRATDTQYIIPDIYIYKSTDGFMILLNEDGMPKLRISNYYKSILAKAKSSQNKVTKEYVQEKLRSAIWLIRSIHNRQRTIYKVTEAILKRQKSFFEKGVQSLKPMVLRDVAQDIGMHESTISRVTTNKFVHTPAGIFELKYFFNSSIQTADGSQAFASESVKEKIRSLIQKEDPKHPLSDQKLVQLLRASNIDIARRTIAKYRDILGILPSSKRKKLL